MNNMSLPHQILHNQDLIAGEDKCGEEPPAFSHYLHIEWPTV